MKITWLGQAGFLFQNENLTIMIDPYLSDSVEKVNPKNYRRVAVDTRFFDIAPDIMIFTHNHLDHYDPETASHFLGEHTESVVLSPNSVWNEIRKFGGSNNYVLFNRHTEWTEKGVRLIAVKAEHSDISAIGVIIDDGNKKYYITGDTLYNTEIFEDMPDNIYVLFLPINGVGNNMNMVDAKRFCERINPQFVIPMHCGMFDEINMNEFEYKNKIVPKIYEEVKLK